MKKFDICKPILLCKQAKEYPYDFLAWVFSHKGMRFSLVGLIATVAYFILGFIFISVLKWPVLIGNALAYLLAFFVSYFGQSKFTFQVRGSHAIMLPAYLATQVGGLLLNSCIVGFCIKKHLPYLLAMLIAAGITPVAVYLTCRFWVFRNRSVDENSSGQ